MHEPTLQVLQWLLLFVAGPEAENRPCREPDHGDVVVAVGVPDLHGPRCPRGRHDLHQAMVAVPIPDPRKRGDWSLRHLDGLPVLLRRERVDVRALIIGTDSSGMG